MMMKKDLENKVIESSSKTDDKKIAEDHQNFYTEEKIYNENLPKRNSTMNVWKVILSVLVFFVGTIVFISLLSMYLTGFK